MSDFEVNFAQLAQAGRRGELIAADARGPLRGMRIDGVSAAVPGGTSGAVADRLDSAWVAAARSLETTLDGYASALSTSAENYRAAEKAAADAVTAFFGATS